jgi:hypothetical protein
LRKSRVKWIAAILSTLVVLALFVLCGFAFLYTRQVDQARAQYEAPTVFITEPVSGQSAPAGSYQLVLATAAGQTPIMSLELWVNGELVEERVSEAPEGVSPFNGYFELFLLEGPSLLFARAVNVQGIVGQSLPVSVMGEPPAGPGETFVDVIVEEGETLEDIAATYGTDPETLRGLNPDLGQEEPAPGAMVMVPVHPEEEEEPAGSSVEPSVPAAPPGSSPVPMPDVPPLKAIPISPGPGATGTFTNTVPLPLMVGSILPTIVAPSFQPPAAPSDLQGQVENCKLRLRWNDNAGDELRYEVWMAGQGSSSQLLGSLQPAGGGAAWVEFGAPHPGLLSFWVEAANAVGKQPSNIVWVQVPQGCPSTLPSQLQVDVLDMTVGGGYDRTYCYVSFEAAPEVRMPEDDSDFIGVQEGRGTVSGLATRGRSFVVPIPADEALQMEGECWGWSGDELSPLGSFSRAYARDTWDGTRRPLEGETYEIGMSVQPLGGGDVWMTVGGEDPTIPAPSGLAEQMLLPMPPTFYTPQHYESWFAQRMLIWAWNGPQKITGFTIFLNGKPYKSVQGAGVRVLPVTLPTIYDQRIRWQVAADMGSARSPLSKEYAYDLPKSSAYVMVTLDSIHWVYHSDSAFGECDLIEAYGRFLLMVEDASGTGPYSQKHCNPGDYHLASCGQRVPIGHFCWSPPDVHQLIVPFNKDRKNFTFLIWVVIYDHDVFSGDDKVAYYVIRHNFTSLQEAQSILGCGKQFQELNSADAGSSSLNYTLTVYPNSCYAKPGTRSPSTP